MNARPTLIPLMASLSRRLAALAAAALIASVLTTATDAEAAIPGRLQVEGTLMAGSGAAPDGDYGMTFHIYDGQSAQAPAASVNVAKVAVAGGRFAALVPTDAATAAKVGGLADPWVGVVVGSDPELPRRPLAAVPFALHAGTASGLTCTGCLSSDTIANGSIAAAKVGFNYAGSATKGGAALDLQCTGCVGVSELSFDGDIDLAGNSLKAKNGTFSGDVVAKSVTATSFVGDGSKLTGLAMPAGSCKAGEVVTGINSDGTLKCASMASSLPSDALDDVSGGMLSTEFKESVASAGALGIPDNTGSDATSTLTAPDWGKAKGLTIKVKVSNTDLSTLRLRLLPPDDKKVGYTLCDPCGDKDVKALDTAWSDKVAPKSGDLSTWLGKSPVGSWTLIATDSAFCVKQAPGNSTLCDLDNKLDGAIDSWSVEVDVVSSQKVQVGGALLFKVASKAPIPCEAKTFGATYANPDDKALYVCNGKDWAAVYLTIPGSKENPVASCKDLLTKVPGSKTGKYWVANNGNAIEVTCDMDTAGGGWTLVADESAVACGGAFLSGWSDTKATDAQVAGACTRVHGMWGTGTISKNGLSTLGVSHSDARIEGRYYAVDSWDGEGNGAQMWVDGAMKWAATKVWSQVGSGAGWVTANFTPAPWGNNSGPNGYWDLSKATGSFSHTASTLTLEFRTGIDQDLSDESWAFSHIKVWVR